MLLFRRIKGFKSTQSAINFVYLLNYISEVIQDPNSQWVQRTGQPGSKYTIAGKPVRWQIEGTRDSVNIKVIVEPDGKGIITAFPTNLPKNP